MQIDFKEIFDSYNKSQEKVWEHDRTKTAGASEIFGCIRSSWFSKHAGGKNKYDPDEKEDSWGAMMRGDILEEHYVVPAMHHGLPEGVKMLMAGADQQTLIHNLNSATPDGLIVGVERDALAKYGVPDLKSNCFMFEIKSIDPRSNLPEEKAVHHGQCQQQMGIIREKTKWRPYFAVIIYVDASFLDKIKVFIVPYEASKWKAAQKRADMIFNTDDPKDLKPEGHFNDGCKFCKWKGACSIVQIGSIPKAKAGEIAEEDQYELSALLDEAKEVEAAMKEAKADLEEIKQEIKDKLMAMDKRWFNFEKDGQAYEASWSSQKGRETFDKKAAEAAGLDLSAFTKTGNPFEKFSIKVKEAE